MTFSVRVLYKVNIGTLWGRVRPKEGGGERDWACYYHCLRPDIDISRVLVRGIENNNCPRFNVRYAGIVLAETWHLSFPVVVRDNGKYYMTTSATPGYTPCIHTPA